MSRTVSRYLARLNRLRAWLQGFEQREYGLTIFYSVLIGIGAGLLGATFHRLMLGIQQLFFRADEEEFLQLAWPVLLLVPILGGAIQALLARLFPEIAARKGVIEVMKSLKRKDGVIDWRTTLFHFVAPALNIGTGGSVGPEGPAVQFGAGVASGLGQFFGVSTARMKVMLAAGAGAAISAMFNAPLGGVFFTLEVILLNDLKEVTFGVLIMSSVVANVVSHMLVGHHEVFFIPTLQVPGAAVLPWFLLLGLAGGVVSVSFANLSGWLAKLVWGRLRAWPRWIFPPLSGLVLGAVATQLPQVLGVGYHGINQLLQGDTPWLVALALLAAKVFLTALNIELGGFGGTIAPSLFMGAMLGGVVGQGLQLLGLFGDPALFVLAGMGTVLAGVNGIPLAAFLLIIEMTGNYDLTIPLMISVAGSTLVIQLLAGERSLYLRKLRKARLLDEEDPTRLLMACTAAELLDPRRPVVADSMPLGGILPAFAQHDLKDLVALDEQGKVTGMVDFATLRHIIGQEDALAIIRTHEIADEVPRVGLQANLVELRSAFAQVAHDYLPVLDDDGGLLGIVLRYDVARAVDRVLNRQMDAAGEWVFK